MRADQTQASLRLYLNRDQPENAFEYRIKPLHMEGVASQFSPWKNSNGSMDITITGADIRPLLATDNESTNSGSVDGEPIGSESVDSDAN